LDASAEVRYVCLSHRWTSNMRCWKRTLCIFKHCNLSLQILYFQITILFHCHDCTSQHSNYSEHKSGFSINI